MQKSVLAVQDRGAVLDELSEVVLVATRAMVALASRTLADQEDLTLLQYRALVVLSASGTVRVAALAESLGVSPSTATRLCDRLVGKGLVRRRRSVEDRREVRIELARPGRLLVDEVTRQRLVAIRSILEAVEPNLYSSLLLGFGEFARVSGEFAEEELSSSDGF